MDHAERVLALGHSGRARIECQRLSNREGENVTPSVRENTFAEWNMMEMVFRRGTAILVGVEDNGCAERP